MDMNQDDEGFAERSGWPDTIGCLGVCVCAAAVIIFCMWRWF
jgi:hypothetical protein